MNKQTTSVSHHNATYNLKIGGWLQHLNSKASEAILQVATEDIILPNGQSVDIYKTEKRQYENLKKNCKCYGNRSVVTCARLLLYA